MENTCKGKDCWFYLLIKDLSGDKSDPDIQNCPFYVEMMFTPNPVGGKIETAKLIKDCVNKRSLLMLLEEVQPRLIGVQKSNEEMRNRSAEAVQTVDQFMNVLSRMRREPELKTYVPPVEIEGHKE